MVRCDGDRSGLKIYRRLQVLIRALLANPSSEAVPTNLDDPTNFQQRRHQLKEQRETERGCIQPTASHQRYAFCARG